ncbi:MAG TPA: DEAD/DEAH box helicase, partial [Acetobacteraceae bacterium]|nr:DEAD/DEAH box helicase [Acetobacteraceae bacterium]
LEAELATGLRAPGLLLLPIGPLLRPRPAAALATGDDAPRVGETVVHLEHGVCRLTGLSAVEDEDRIALEFAGGVELLIAPDELDRVWRYGEGGASLDRIGGEAWHEKRQEIERELAGTAEQLAKAAAARAAAEAPALRPDPERYALVTRRFPHLLSPDQRAAIHAVLKDLAAGRKMDRLLCGDVGFGKTEVAIRAAAAAAMAGWQVAIAAPTTVLARQHLDLFRARFQGTGLRVEGLVRATASKEGRAVRAAVKRGEVDIVIGTQGLAGLQYKKLGLAVIDEEQRFGEADKARLAGLSPHLLVMTATPIPRTMQAALVGLRDVSVLATPPQNRQPIRTFVLPWDPVVVREALLRESRRGGQSFLVCPRIADIAPMQARLAELAPELDVVVAHGRMQPEALETAVLDFAAGRGDVLLATNIIEAGLDIPRANLMLVTNADRFGLAQLHQLRGRVGRSARRGAAYFLTEPGRRLTTATRRRLATMEALTGLGAGVAISAADLDLRGAGDLFGVAQAGHLRAVGTELYQHLLSQAIARQRGEPPPPPAPELRVELSGRIPDSYVPEVNLRILLLRRLARLAEPGELDEFAEELQDRFGPPPPETAVLLVLQRLRLLCRRHRIARLDAGPHALALTPDDEARLDGLAKATGGTVKQDRVLVPLAVADPLERAQAATRVLEKWTERSP